MTEAEIRAAVNRWSAGRFFRQKRFGDQISIVGTTPAVAFVVRLQALCEQRSVASVREVRPDGPSDREFDGDPRTIPVTPPKNFEDASATLRLRGTRRTGACTDCRGRKTIACEACNGSGKRKCPRCIGAGVVWTNQFRPVFKGGKTVMEPQRVSIGCGCAMGKVPCGACGASGHKKCPACGATGEITTIDVLHVTFSTTSARRVVNATGVPDDLLTHAAGELIVDADAVAVSAPDGVPPELNEAVRATVQACGCAGGTIRRRLTIARVPICSVQYIAGRDAARKLWIYGTEAAVHAPDVPSRWFGWLSRS